MAEEPPEELKNGLFCGIMKHNQKLMTQQDDDQYLIDHKHEADPEQADQFESIFMSFYETEVKEVEDSMEVPKKFVQKPVQKKLSNFEKISDNWF